MTEKIVRACGRNEDPTDWMAATGQLSPKVYDIMREGYPTVAAKNAAEVAAGKRPPTPKVTVTAARGHDGRVAAATPFDPNGTYARNPLVAQAQRQGTYVAAAETDPNVPTLFASGDRPPFTASGVDPMVLDAVPWFARHALAAETDRGKALEMYQEMSGPDGEVAAQQYADHAGNRDYELRVMNWVSKGWDNQRAKQEEAQRVAAARRAQQIKAAVGPVEGMTPDQAYESVFGAVDRRRAAEIAEREKSIAEGRAILGSVRRR